MNKNELTIIDENEIKNKIYTIRGLQIMFDSDLAQIYGVETRQLNRFVKRNIERFPENFMFQLNDIEYKNLMPQIVTSNSKDNNSMVPNCHFRCEKGITKCDTLEVF